MNIRALSYDRDKMRRVIVNLVNNALQTVSASKDQAARRNADYHTGQGDRFGTCDCREDCR